MDAEEEDTVADHDKYNNYNNNAGEASNYDDDDNDGDNDNHGFIGASLQWFAYPNASLTLLKWGNKLLSIDIIFVKVLG